MRLLEYESKELLAKYQISIPKGTIVSSSEGVNIDKPVVVKAQIPLGGRGKAGGILEASTTQDAKEKINNLLAIKVRGYRSKKLLVEDKVDIKQEFFMAITYDSVIKEPIAIFTREGGVDVEELAARDPKRSRRKHFQYTQGFQSIVLGKSFPRQGFQVNNC